MNVGTLERPPTSKKLKRPRKPPILKITRASGKKLCPALAQGTEPSVALAPSQPAGLDVRRIRQAFGLTQVEFARLTGYTPRTVQEWESGKRALTGSVLKSLTELSTLLTALQQFWQPGRIGPWLKTDNQMMAGRSPLNWIAEGRQDVVWRFLYALEAGDMS